MIRAVIFDVGECLVDETTEYGTWADWLGVPRHTFAAMFGAVIAQGRDYRETFQEFRPGFDLYAERERRAAAGKPETFGEDDLYPDVRDALAALRADGLWLGIAGNQTVRAGRILRQLFSNDVDLIGTSDDWGAGKPDRAFFDRVAEVVPAQVDEMLYVGDRVDNDIRPAAAAGDGPRPVAGAAVLRGPRLPWTAPRAGPRRAPVRRAARSRLPRSRGPGRGWSSSEAAMPQRSSGVALPGRKTATSDR
ncbi:HAD family hydrolase [Streptomyces sp. SCL15-4]|uniref:HAD family hydrolase n=1 Tax=Streptomyces sp. SCL15-4 TaxID=2967221 RepID=UPI0029669AE0|nr:HAD family hydrolase [Streptomyces sp. SCL15-4]